MSRVIVIVIAIVALSACASAPINFGKPSSSSTIGMIYLIDEHPKHSHVGTTIFQNFDTTSATSTDFQSQFAERCTNLLSNAGYDVREIEPTELLSENRNGLFSYASSSVYFKPAIKSELNRLASTSNLDFVIVVYPLSGPAWVNSAANIDGYGLYTECRFGKCSAQALSYVDARIYDVQNQSALKGSGFRYFQNPTMPDTYVFDEPKKIEPEIIDEAASIALDTFIALFERMLRASQFLE